MSPRARAGDTAWTLSRKGPRAGFIMACDTIPEEEQSCDRRFWSREALLFNKAAQQRAQSYHSISVGIKAISDITLKPDKKPFYGRLEKQR